MLMYYMKLFANTFEMSYIFYYYIGILFKLNNCTLITRFSSKFHFKFEDAFIEIFFYKLNFKINISITIRRGQFIQFTDMLKIY